MYIKAGTLDDLLGRVFERLLKSRTRVDPTKGPNVEIAGVVLELTQPRARLSRTDVKGHVFSCLGELFWYLSASNDLAQIRHYIQKYEEFAEEDGTVNGAYGPRIFGGSPSQFENVTRMLREKRSTRQAVIQIFDKADVAAKFKDVPCTCTLQFLLRDEVLSLVVHMRSNDAFKGLPHDVFAFTFMQEMHARELGCRVGTYKHLVGSLHLYDSDRDAVKEYLEEGLQPTLPMPPMPDGPQQKHISVVVSAEARIRLEGTKAIDEILAMASSLPDYWVDLIRLFSIHRVSREYAQLANAHPVDGVTAMLLLRRLSSLSKSMSTRYYATYIRKRTARVMPSSGQMELV